MRRAALVVGRLASTAGACAHEAAVTQAVGQLPALAGSSSGQVRGFASGEKVLPPTVPNPLQQIVPPIISGFKAAVSGIDSGSKGLLEALKNSSATRGTIAYVADKVILSGDFLALSDVDVAKWAVWLADNAYTNPTGWATIKKGLAERLAAGKLSPAEVEACVVALHKSRNYDRDLFEGFSKVVKERFMEFDTPGLCRLIAAYTDHNHFDADLWDDVADSITYCNHYFAPMNCSLTEIAEVYASYAKYRVDRGDLFVALARCLYDLKFKGADDKELGQVIPSLFRSWMALDFWPEATQPMLVEAKLRPGAFSPADQGLLAEVEDKVRAAAGGKLSWVDGGYAEDHYHGSAWGDYNLWVARDELFPQYYRPSDVKVLRQGRA